MGSGGTLPFAPEEHHMRPLHLAAAACCLLSFWPSTALAQLGALIHDGPATPEQISLYMPVTGALAATVGTVRYRPSAEPNWTTAHPLHRIRPAFTEATVQDAFAGVITGLTPGTDYTVEVTVSLGSSNDVKTLTATTRALPPPAGAANKTIAPGSTSAAIQAIFNALNPGDVLRFENGTYNIDNLQLNRSGTDAQPIYIRGASRTGVVLRDTAGRVLHLLNASNVVIEDLTLEGSSFDSGTASTSEGIRLFEGNAQRRVTVRRVTMRGVDKAFVAEHTLEQILIYDCTLTGNNVWTTAFIDANITWNDDGVRVPGQGNAVFNNTLSGFGDTFAVNDGALAAGIHFYRNDIRMTGDDAFEGDYGFRNMTFYDNRIRNSMTLVSFDPIRGGPVYVFRNVAINVGRSPFKFNSPNTGHFIYNNTIIRTNGSGAHTGWGWVQFNNGDQRAWAYRNNLLIYRGSGNLFAMEAGGHNPVDFTNNGWYPNAAVWWSTSGGSFSSMTAARTGLPATTPLFGSSTRRHENDVITEADPFAQDVTMGNSYVTEITTPYSPALTPGSIPSGAGVAIPGITDGFSGAAPDIGAIIAGIGPPTWGDRNPPTSVPLDLVPPSPPGNLRPR